MNGVADLRGDMSLSCRAGEVYRVIHEQGFEEKCGKGVEPVFHALAFQTEFYGITGRVFAMAVAVELHSG